MDPTVIAAIISGIVAFLGIVVSIISVRWNIRHSNKELDLKKRELDTTIKKLSNDIESIRQAQFSETLRKRLENYPNVWKTIQYFTNNWDEGRPRDIIWVKEFLTTLNHVDNDYGVFFSESVYFKFQELQNFLKILYEELSLSNNSLVGFHNLGIIDAIVLGQGEIPGLASYLKDDLGSYRETLIQARSISYDHIEPYLYEKAEMEFIRRMPVTVWIKPEQKEPEQVTRVNEGLRSLETILCIQKDYKRTLETLRKIIAVQILKDPNRKIDATSSLFLTGMMSSFNFMDLVMAIEKEFDVDLGSIQGTSFDNLLELTALIITCKNAQKTIDL